MGRKDTLVGLSLTVCRWIRSTFLLSVNASGVRGRTRTKIPAIAGQKMLCPDHPSWVICPPGSVSVATRDTERERIKERARARERERESESESKGENKAKGGKKTPVCELSCL